MLDAIALFRLAGDRMHYLTDRQAVIARNIANADTPGYQAQDTAPFTPVSPLLRNSVIGSPTPAPAAPLALVSTNPAHFGAQAGAAPAVAAATATATARDSYAEKPDGNTVSLDQQLIKQADVADNFALASAAYSKALTLLKLGIDYGK